MSTVRECGSCDACCVHFKIDELKKPAGVRCTNLCPSGCAIYAIRPAPCRAFRCLWLDGRDLIPGLRRPDLEGLILDDDALPGQMLRVTQTARNVLKPAALDRNAFKAGYVIVRLCSPDQTVFWDRWSDGMSYRIEKGVELPEREALRLAKLTDCMKQKTPVKL